MSRRFHITIELEMPDDCREEDARLFGASLLETAFTAPNPIPRGQVPFGQKWEPTVRLPAAMHPYRPKCVGAIEIAQPRPRGESG